MFICFTSSRFSSARSVSPLAALIVAAGVLTASPALGGVIVDPPATEEFRHEVRVMGKLGNHPNVIQFIGATNAEAAIVPVDPGNGRKGDNPLYTGQGVGGENPLFDSAAPPNTPPGAASVSFILDSDGLQPSVNGEGVVHRDIAARNFIVTTNTGTYASSPDQFLLFGNDGGLSVVGDRASGGVGPIRWMAPESLRLLPVTPPSVPLDPDDYFDILAGSSFTVNYLPEPTSAAALLVLGLPALVRRRRG